MVRQARDETLAVIHTFADCGARQVELPAAGKKIRRVLCTENNRVSLEGGKLKVELKAPFEAVAVYLA